MKNKLIVAMILSLLMVFGSGMASAIEIINLVGDKDQNPPPDPDGWGIVHELDDPTGFDMRQVATTVSWIHDISSAIQGLTLTSARLDIAAVGLIDGNYSENGKVINNKLFVDGNEILGAFDNSNDGWRLYTFDINTQWLLDGKLNISIVTSTDPQEGWGGPDFSELYVFADTSAIPEPATMILLGSGLIGLAGYGRKKFKK
jgi:hypothetical protein